MAERSECIPELLKTLKPFLMECTGDLRPGNNDTSATARDKSREKTGRPRSSRALISAGVRRASVRRSARRHLPVVKFDSR